MAFNNETDRLWSQYRFMVQLLKAKKDYYKTGTSKLTDQQYDSLESSFIVLHGRALYDSILGVGYNEGSLEIYKKKLKELNESITTSTEN